MTRFHALVLGSLALSPFGACKPVVPPSPSLEEIVEHNPVLANAVGPDGTFIRRFDVDGDGKEDILKYFQLFDDQGQRIADPTTVTPEQAVSYKLVKQELDVNLDGNIDMVRTYDGRQKLVQEQADSDFTGTLDNTVRFRDGIETIARVDIDHNGTAETTRVYRAGELARVEVDSNGDGHPETLNYYEDNLLTRVGVDLNSDGTIDDWQSLRTIKVADVKLPSSEGSGR